MDMPACLTCRQELGSQLVYLDHMMPAPDMTDSGDYQLTALSEPALRVVQLLHRKHGVLHGLEGPEREEWQHVGVHRLLLFPGTDLHSQWNAYASGYARFQPQLHLPKLRHICLHLFDHPQPGPKSIPYCAPASWALAWVLQWTGLHLMYHVLTSF